jgi:hypothetical protein
MPTVAPAGAPGSYRVAAAALLSSADETKYFKFF